MADCIVFCSAKACSDQDVARLAAFSKAAMAAGVPFTVVADAVYYAPHDADAQTLAKRIVATSLRQGQPLRIGEAVLSGALALSI